jgi:hypothetical protein
LDFYDGVRCVTVEIDSAYHSVVVVDDDGCFVPARVAFILGGDGCWRLRQLTEQCENTFSFQKLELKLHAIGEPRHYGTVGVF